MDSVVEDEVLERAYVFVRSNGSRLTRALASHASGRTGIDDSLKDLLLLQNPDGGWRGLDSDMEAALSTISQTYVGLKWLYWLRPTDSAPVDRAVEFLRRSQQPDGYWDEPDEILEHSPPPWMAPGDFANQVWLTVAMCSRLVLHSRQGDVRFDEAVEFLRAAWDGSRFPRYNHTHWVSLVVFGLMDDPTAIDREIFEGCAGFLERTLAEGRTDAVDLIETARDALYAGQWGTRLSEAALPKLLASQAGDGGWTTGYGDRHRPVSTVEAIYVLKLAASRRPSETA